MSLTDEQAVLLRQVAKQTPMGRLLRRYWHPVATVADLTLERPTRRVRILSENLVLFKDRAGRAALIPERCPHEGASMLVGRVTENGIRCLLHGWFFDTERMCSIWDDDSVWAEGYPAREHAGLYWAYLGSGAPPDLPGNDALSGSDGRRRIIVYPPLRCHWLLPGRFGLDPWRLYSHIAAGAGDAAPAEVTSVSFDRSSDGVVRRLAYADGSAVSQGYSLPARLHAGPLWLLTPMGEEQTMVISVELIPDGAGGSDGQEPEIVVLPAGERSAAVDPDERHSFFEPWGSAGLEMIQELLLERVAAVAAESA